MALFAVHTCACHYYTAEWMSVIVLKNTHTHLRAAIIHRRKGLTSNEIKRSLARVQTNSTYDYLFVRVIAQDEQASYS